MRDQQRNRKAPLDEIWKGFDLGCNLAPKTRKAYADAFRVFLAWMQEHGYQGVLGELDPQLVREWQRHLEEQQKRSVNTVRAYLSALKSFSHYLAEDGITRDAKGHQLDLLAGVKIPKAPSKRPEVYADDELERVLDAINRQHVQGARNSAFIRLLLDSGLRLNEACQLRIADVDWDSGRIHVRSETAKRKKERFTGVGKRTLAELKRYRQHFRPADTALPNLFIDQDGGPLTTNAVQCMLARLRKKLGLPRLTAHGFRRSWATAFRRLGVGDLYDLQRMGGWADLEVPQRFYVDTEADTAQRPSVLDLWETQRRKRQRGRPIQVGE